ncbi:hypothetical protein LZ318_17830 [Saccharopolyspora indica]|uniref:hypothetical protein n=1 Tax=Saccharopolyspora indica TaxID=1229659 RepID=UPI0022EA8767|nr:hypothetical protein [Saccharopolyspora indica]MDA3648294.1 hypothetical protein [Saccharopolyspora indica]
MTSLIMFTVCVGTAMIAAGWVWRTFAAYGQHSGSGEGALTVWQLIAHVEEERQQRENQGRHRLREPHRPDDAPPSLDLQQRALNSLYRI